MRIEEFLNKEKIIAVIGLGYVGMPLLYHLSKYFKTIGFDVKRERVEELKKGIDSTGELEGVDFLKNGIEFSCDESVLDEADVFIVAVPTPIDKHKLPDLRPLRSATNTVARHIKKGSIVVYESTVYPFATKEECVPILENVSNLRYCQDFFVGYSPERINPGDKVHTPDKITKIVSGCNQETAELLAKIYGQINNNNIFIAESIEVAEAAKVIENTQRDINIALMNELSKIFNMMGINTYAVLNAAKTKWNFLAFEPGLVGGHCIGVDPYYLTYKAQEIGYHPEVILSGRRINDSMGEYVAKEAVKKLIKSGRTILSSRALILGITFKENVPDIRNSRVIDIVRELEEFGVVVDVFDPLADEKEVKNEYGIELRRREQLRSNYDLVVLAVKHKDLLDEIDKWINLTDKGGVFVDIKGVVDKNKVKNAIYWSL
ncbi:nucleotide sugar dehydrogenase [Hippea maritima]|uniref:Nucleotide sugar dehydrogenase n=1 Tax=Hippea maritima (strain ATCC 700847 / DSM 10411 / MH2) TaxID=760142 RepID=F2LXG9_HIPMA|nr:nucleotide sugar dehydrogenase [Hippea maritima]AEA33155.1 nucleotide sugar dehydrogenase [Hippea maritima DSM 10411]